MVLIKLLYLADRAMLMKHGQPITGDAMVSMTNGPVLSRVLDLINDGDRSGGPWVRHVSEPANYEVGLKETTETDELSAFELRLLEKVYAKFGKMDKWALVDWCHKNLAEWRDPNGSALPISPADILRAVDRPEAEIDRVRRDAEEMWLIDTLVG